MAWYKLIYRFQEIDLELLRIRRRLGEIAAALKDDAALVAARRAAEAKTTAASAAQQAQKDLEFELERVRIKLEQTENALYGGRITNARELQDLQAESKSLKRHQATLEDQLLEAMVVCEETTAAAAVAQEALRLAQQTWDDANRGLTVERDQLDAQAQALQDEAESLKPQLPPDVLDTYDYLRERSGGVPVARLKGDVCDCCGVEVLRSTLRKVNQHEVAYCDSCHRLLVVI